MVINWLDCVWYELTLKGISEQTLSRGHLLVELSLARLFNSHWHNASTVTSMVVQQSLTRLFDRRWHDCSTVTGMIVHQSLARVFNSRWHNYSTVAGTIFQQSLARFFNSYWHDSSTMAGTILQQSRSRFFSFFYAGRILEQRCSLLKNRAMYQEYDTWSNETLIIKKH